MKKLLNWIELWFTVIAGIICGIIVIKFLENKYGTEISDNKPESEKNFSLEKFNLISLAIAAIMMVVFCFMVHYKWITGLKYMVFISFVLAVAYLRLFFVVIKRDEN